MALIPGLEPLSLGSASAVVSSPLNELRGEGTPADPQENPGTTSSEEETVSTAEQLRAMFPHFDPELVDAVIASAGSTEQAVQHLLEMGSSDGAPGAPAGSTVDSDEEIAMALFKELLQDAEGVPDELRSDPAKYEAFVREQMQMHNETGRQEAGASPGQSSSQQAAELFSKLSVGGAKLFERMVKSAGQLTKPRTERFARMGEFCAPLVSPADESSSSAAYASTSTRNSASSAYAPPATVSSPLSIHG